MKQFTYRTLYIVVALAVLIPYLHQLVVYVAFHAKQHWTMSLMHLPFPLSYLKALGENPLFFGGYFPAFNAILKLLVVVLVAHRAFRIVREKKFSAPASYGTPLFIVSFLGCFSFFIAIALVVFAMLVPSYGAIAFLSMYAAIGMLVLPIVFTISELLSLKVYVSAIPAPSP